MLVVTVSGEGVGMAALKLADCTDAPRLPEPGYPRTDSVLERVWRMRSTRLWDGDGQGTVDFETHSFRLAAEILEDRQAWHELLTRDSG
jgi:hypothetical protein